ncbi:MAG TPA: terminase family protein, partial [Pyrinomonadaceae bacterium]|nr:terminase family protein [Pyrinomonadaceae bacterium]
GSFQMWSLDSAETVRGRKYALALIDEAAMVPDLENTWNAVIRPTLTDYEGGADFYSTPKGLNYFYSLFNRASDDANKDWAAWQMPTAANPFIKSSEIEAARLELPTDVFRQEYLAEFIQGEGAVFRNITANLIAEKDKDGVPLTKPEDHVGHKKVAGGDWGQVNDFTVVSVGCETCKRELELLRFNKIDWEFQRRQALNLLDKWDVSLALFEENSIGSPNLEALQKTSSRDIRGFMTTAQSKSPLIQSLALCLEQSEMKFLDIPIATRELEAYEARKNKMTGRISYNAPKGFHDDTVIARALMREAANQPVYVAQKPVESSEEYSGW